jgi:hypothetical protein
LEESRSYEPEDLLARLARIRAVTWEWRDDETVRSRGLEPGTRAAGVIAQELEAVFPELVVTDDDGIKHVDYAGLVALVLEGVKELDARVRALEATLDGEL